MKTLLLPLLLLAGCATSGATRVAANTPQCPPGSWPRCMNANTPDLDAPPFASVK